jgi:hypothetical protein
MTAAASASYADFFANFEPPDYVGSASGVVATGQQGWTLPAGIDAMIFTYAGNAWGFAPNPNGGQQFLATESQGGTSFGRAQHAHDFSTRSLWTVSYDFAARWRGTPPSAINLSSFSLQNSATDRTFIALNNWDDLNNPTTWRAEYNVFTAAGAAFDNQSPGAAWTGLQPNTWYRQSTTFDLNTNQIVSVAIGLVGGTPTTFNPTGWYLRGGASPTQPLPTAVRFFAGGAAGNTMGWDNLSVVPEPATLAALGIGCVALLRRRRR